jgi:hypothetical protein
MIPPMEATVEGGARLVETPEWSPVVADAGEPAERR